ncbi:DUF6221 family protein [Streptomyces sp. NPDC086783]|uniref:DUF6221 family protein n=1 Tax=Streptomyces sp. NPDC086783 TaxID=3365758 RepID=UPI003818D8B2
MDELVRWLGEQLDEDEQIARASDPELNQVLTRIEPLSSEMAAEVRHIAAHRPARVLREVHANRRRLERHTPQMMVGRNSDPADPTTYVLGCPLCQVTILDGDDWPCVELRDMVAGYVDRAGCREEWKP